MTPAPLLGRAAGTAARLLTLAVLALTGWVLVLSVRGVFADPRPLPPPPADPRDLGDLAPEAPLAGEWTAGPDDVPVWPPAPPGTAATRPPAPPLAPLPATAETVARRWAGGRLVAEVVRLAGGAEAVRAALTAAGWAASPDDTDGGFAATVAGRGVRVQPLADADLVLLTATPRADP